MPLTSQFSKPGLDGRARLSRIYVLIAFLSAALLFFGFKKIEHYFATGVVAEWRMNEGTGTAVSDQSGNGYNASLVNGAAWTTGRYGQGVALDGTNDYINVPDNPNFTLDPAQSYTWSAWVRNNSFREWSTIWSQTISPSNFFYFYAHSTADVDGGPVSNGISIYWVQNNGGSKICLHSNNNVLTTGQWSYVTITYNGGLAPANRFTIYVNGNDVTNRGDVATSGTLTTLDPVNIRLGSNEPYGEYFPGAIDEARYYRRVLSPAEITADMNSGTPPPADPQAPVVNFLVPTNGANLSGTVIVTASVTDDKAVRGVQFLLNGANLGSEKLAPPFNIAWPTTVSANGPHTLTARARDWDGNVTTVNINVTVNNNNQSPVVSITSPAAGNVSGTVNLAAQATDDVSVAGVQFLVNGTNFGAEDLSAPYTIPWNTTSLTNGSYTISARARDGNGNITVSAAVPVTVNNLPQAPVISITSPAPGNVSGTVNLTAQATDDVGVVGVQFMINGSDYGAEDLTAPYSVVWNTTSLISGNFTISARARDASGNVTTSAGVAVTLTSQQDTQLPVVSLTSPTGGSVTGMVTLTANATDNVGVAGVQFLLDGVNIGNEDETAPYSISWNSATATNGSHTLTARARDAAGNARVSTAINITVNNNATLVAAYGLNENTGTLAGDISGNNHNGTLTNGPTWSTGEYGQAVTFDGTNDYINIADHNNFTLDPAQSYTWSAWVRNTNFREWSTVWSQTLNTSNFFYFYAHTTADPDGGPVTNGVSVYWWVNNGASKLGAHSSNNVLTANQWSHITVTYDGSQPQANRFTIYVNGNDVTVRNDITSVGTISTLNPTNIRIGSNQAFGEYLTGSVDEVRFYRRLLTEPEVLADMNTPVSPDHTAPVVTMTAPANASTVSGTVTLSANATDNAAVTGVQFLLDGQPIGSEDVAAPYTISWNTSGTSNGAHTLSARARDGSGNLTTSSPITVTVNNVPDTQQPQVSLTAPTGGNVSGTINVTATATDNVAITGVQFLLDGNPLGAEDMTAPYAYAWNTATATPGSHLLSARARDAAGNTRTSTTVTVNVQAGGAPIITGVNVTNITMNSVVINWTTNTPTTSKVNYGTTTAYGSTTLEDDRLVTAHSQVIYSLNPGTTYQYKVTSTNAAGSIAESGNGNFTSSARPAPSGSLNSHSIYRDATNAIIPWTPNPANGYVTVMNLAWNYLLNTVPNDPSTGKPAYYSRSFINPNTQQMANWPHNPAGLYAMLIESAVKYYNFSADPRVMTLAQEIALWHLDHGMTDPTDSWPSVPYASGDAGSSTYRGAVVGNGEGVGDGVGFIQPDKVGELGNGFLQLYKYSGNIRFRDAAIQAGNVLSSKVRTGNQTQSPWPFRVNARTGAVREDYGSSIIGSILLLDGLIEAGLGNTAAYQTARNTAFNWMMTYPVKNNNWSQYFEDVPVQPIYNSNLNQLNALQVALYLMDHPEYDPNWQTNVRNIITWVENRFSQTAYGAIVIREQFDFAYIMGSHSSRYASVNARLYELTGDLAAKEKAYRSFNWSTYMCRTNGIVIDGPDVNSQWFTDGYGDYIRHFMTGIAAVPEWSPFNENHILRSTSVLKNIVYSPTSINYTTFDGTATEVVHVNFMPTSVTANGVTLQRRTDLNQPGWTIDVATKTIKIYHVNATQISITGDAARNRLPDMTDWITKR